KLTAMYAAGDTVDVSQSPMQYLANYIEQGIALPIDGLPGVEQYVRDFTPFTRAIAQRDGKTWGLPYFSTVWTFMYNDELLTRAGFKDKPFRSYPELVDQARKAKRDGVARYPILWIGGQGFEQLPGTWFSLTCNAGRHVYLGTLHHYYVSLINDAAQSPIAGKGRVLGHPGDGKTIGYTMLYILTGNTKDREWAWKLLQYLGGRTKNGEYTQANRLATDAMLGSGYQSVMDSELLRKGWSKWGDVPTILSAWKGATNFAEVVPTVSQPWYPRWSDMMNVELTACLQGKVTADQACDNMVAAVAKAKRA